MARRLMVVAHPDDETLWGGGLILRNPGGWTIVACSVPVADPVRAEKFHEACARLGAAGRVLPNRDRYGEPLESLDIDLAGYDLVVTHGAEGEYGHPHHQQVSAHVRAIARCEVATFGYHRGQHRLDLSEAERARKLHALQAYDHVLPYEGRELPKWRALLDRYGEVWLEREFYDGA